MNFQKKEFKEEDQQIIIPSKKIYIKQKDGFLYIISEKEFKEEKRMLFRAYTIDQNINFLNYDSKNTIPYMKDILNRKHNFIEILYLKGIMIFTMVLLFTSLFIGIFTYKTYKLNTDTNKNIGQGIENIDGKIKTIIETNKPL